MRAFAVAVLLLIPLVVVGCAPLTTFLDWVVGVDESGNDVPGNSPVDWAGLLLNYAVPGAGAALTAGGGFYAAIRRGKQWKQIAIAGMDAVEAIGNTEPGKQAKERLKQFHVSKKLVKLVKPIVEGYGHKK